MLSRITAAGTDCELQERPGAALSAGFIRTPPRRLGGETGWRDGPLCVCAGDCERVAPKVTNPEARPIFPKPTPQSRERPET